MKNKHSIKLNLLFNLSNRYISITIVNIFTDRKILSLSTQSVFFRGLNNRNCTIISKLLGLICNKILVNKKINMFNFNKINSKYRGKVKYFVDQIRKKNII